MPRNRLFGRSIRQWSGGELSFKKPNIRLEKLASSRINKGMITAIDSVDLPLEALQWAKNAKILFDKTSRRDGLVTFGPEAPNANAVIKMASIKHPDGTGHTYRFTPSTIHDLQSGVWNPITETVALAGTVNDKIKLANLFDIIAFTNNGANEVQWIDTGADTSDDLIENLHADVGTSANFRYCTGFYNRLVCASIREENEVMLAWTGEYGSKNTAKHGFEDINTVINETSGFSPLIDSPNDKSDFITGVFGLSNVMVILREKSVWLATKQPSAIYPFNAYPVVPGIGCDTPHSAIVTAFGLCWLDRRTKTIYLFSPGSQPQPIGRPIEKSLLATIDNPDSVFAIYDPKENVYSVCIPSDSSPTVQVWSFYFNEQAWTYNEYSGLTSYDEVELLAGYTTIDELLGTMGDLIPTYNNLTTVVKPETKRIYGLSDGSLAIADATVDTDIDDAFETTLISKSFTIPSLDAYVAEVVVEYIARIPCTLEFLYCADGRDHPDLSFTLGDTFEVTVLNKPQIITFKRVIHCRRFAFAIKSIDGQFDILSYEVWIAPSGDLNMVRQVS